MKQIRLNFYNNESDGVNINNLFATIFQRFEHLEALYLENCALHDYNVFMKEYVAGIVFDLRCFGKARPIISPPGTLRLLSFRNVSLSSPLLLFKVISRMNLPNLEVLDFNTQLYDASYGIPISLSCLPQP